MPYMYTGPIAPFTPLNAHKKMYQVTYQASVTITALGVIDGVVLEPCLISGSQAPLALFYKLNPTNNANYVTKYGAAKTLLNLPAISKGYRYIGGHLKVVATGQYTPAFAGRYYEPSSSTTAQDWTWPNLQASPITSYANDPSIIINCVPSSLEYKVLVGDIYGYYPRRCYHFQLTNTLPDQSITADIIGEWWFETYEPVANSITYIQDIYCPYKMAEYVIGKLADSYVFINESNKTTLFAGIEGVIDNALDTIVNSWDMVVQDVVVQYNNTCEEGGGGDGGENTPPDPGIDSDDEWAARPRLWNP